jgi:hypothetical protein
MPAATLPETHSRTTGYSASDTPDNLLNLLHGTDGNKGKQSLRIDFLAPPFAGHLHLCWHWRAAATRHQVRVISTPAAQAAILQADLPAHCTAGG